ncbi:MAG: FAD-binding oxidoreductase [Saprospiraceae bacterium]|nr:FAD-binding oxidoreductase [Candidatus Opimibacter iunctus]
MDKKILIVGHGLAGCALAMTCYKRNIPFRLIGHTMPGEASMASSGLIAPITGRRYVKAWRIDEFLAKAKEFYHWTESLLGSSFFFPVEIVRYLPHQEGRMAWERRLDDPEYTEYISSKKYADLDQLGKPYGILTGGYRLETPGWIQAVRAFLATNGLFEELDEPYVTDPAYDGHVIYATGAVDPTFAERIIPNKGESLLVKMPGWHIKAAVKEEVFIMPLDIPDRFWIGSYYQPWPDDPFPSEEGKNRILGSISKVYREEVEVLAHMAGVRPTVNDRRPLIGSMPGHPGAFIFNGMGTKGTSLAPYWADQLISYIQGESMLPGEVLPDRYIPVERRD